MALIFEKVSLRTRVSFEAGVAQLGGHALFLSTRDLQLGRGETIEDTSRVLARYVDAIMARVMQHQTLEGCESGGCRRSMASRTCCIPARRSAT